MDEFSVAFFAFLGGMLPALAWLWFWNREDAKNPEPRHLLALAFLAGMLTVAVVIPLQRYSAAAFTLSTTPLFILWSSIEELAKYVAARMTVLSHRAYNEPIDGIVYMVTVALGFAAVENALFLIGPLTGNEIVTSIYTGNFRFVGATLLHVLSSATIGCALAFSFYRSRTTQRTLVFLGIILAIVLHSSFNFLILNTPDDKLLFVFAGVWAGIIVLLALIERIKRMRRPVIMPTRRRTRVR